MKQRPSVRFLPFVAAAVLLSPAFVSSGLSQVVVAPTAFTSTEGNTGSTLFPYGGQFGATTAQWIISSSQLGLTAGDVLNAISFRADGSASGALPPADINYASYQITIGAAATTPATMSDTFAANFASSSVVRSGPLTISANSQPGGSVPNAFGSSLNFNTPFTYAGGDLVIEIRASSSSPSSSVLIDGDQNAASGYGTDYRGKFNFSSSATTSSFDVNVPITQISFTPVPEPATYGLLSGLGLAAFALVRRVKRA